MPTAHAHARDDEPSAEARSEARTLAAQGSDAFEAGDFATALARFDRAAQLVEAPTISLMQARIESVTVSAYMMTRPLTLRAARPDV